MSSESCDLNKIKKIVKEKAKEGKISCPMAHKIAKELGVSPKVVGDVVNELEIKLYGCQLGCF
ncbi:hypothetical protein [Candidatus Oleimmundimicrobium sp.]|uniref:hypothetical protein n=1 Tax=Candidatus Oleimmundimicrobium sp. TaxID=3060597 RepID=UPI002715F8C4|nr:hypothetical protein [Candidatus Oleimmundimicrobium sp.]MDO8886891.1 hypothetical protein [Candidatus Oleimmundimicrobium sp.]